MQSCLLPNSSPAPPHKSPPHAPTPSRYFFVGFQPSAHLFFIFWIVLSMFQLISEGLGLLCAVVATHATYAVIMLTFILLLLLSFSGFLMTKVGLFKPNL